MYVVWHHDKIAHVVTYGVEVQQAVVYNACQLGTPQNTLAVAEVKASKILARECRVELPLLRFR
jgi:hypothetical protein